MIVKHKIDEFYKVKDRFAIPNVIGMRAAKALKPGAVVGCVFQGPNGEQIELEGEVAFELHSIKGEYDPEKIGGSLFFQELPFQKKSEGWQLFVSVPC